MEYLRELFAAVLILYLVECLLITGRDALIFSSRGSGNFRIKCAGDLPGSLERGVLLAAPLPPLGTMFVTQFWPLAFSPEGLSTCRVQRYAEVETISVRPEFIPFDDVGDVVAEGDRISVNGKRVVRTGNQAIARGLADLIDNIARLPQAQRAAAVQQAVTESMDTQRVADIYARLEKHGSILRVACNALFLFIFVMFPLVVCWQGLSNTWPEILIMLFGLWFGVVVAYYRAHRAVCPELASERRSHAFVIALTPMSAVRAFDVLTKERLAGAHPLAVARILCSKEVFQEFARDVWRDLVHFPRAFEAGVASEADAVTAWNRELLRQGCEDLLREVGLEPADLLAPPNPEDDRTVGYCLRCRSQYVHANGECPHCPGVVIQPFDTCD